MVNKEDADDAAIKQLSCSPLSNHALQAVSVKLCTDALQAACGASSVASTADTLEFGEKPAA